LEILINDPDKRKLFGTNGRKHVKRLYSWNMCLDKMITLYQYVFQKHKNRFNV